MNFAKPLSLWKRKIDIAVISDVHLGTYGCRANELCRYLTAIDPSIPSPMVILSTFGNSEKILAFIAYAGGQDHQYALAGHKSLLCYRQP